MQKVSLASDALHLLARHVLLKPTNTGKSKNRINITQYFFSGSLNMLCFIGQSFQQPLVRLFRVVNLRTNVSCLIEIVDTKGSRTERGSIETPL